jgi:hypothetical protein
MRSHTKECNINSKDNHVILEGFGTVYFPFVVKRTASQRFSAWQEARELTLRAVHVVWNQACFRTK